MNRQLRAASSSTCAPQKPLSATLHAFFSGLCPASHPGGLAGDKGSGMHALKGKTDLPQLPQHGLHLSPSSSELSGLSSTSLGVERGNQPNFIQNRCSRSDQGKEDLVEIGPEKSTTRSQSHQEKQMGSTWLERVDLFPWQGEVWAQHPKIVPQSAGSPGVGTLLRGVQTVPPGAPEAPSHFIPRHAAEAVCQ